MFKIRCHDNATKKEQKYLTSHPRRDNSIEQNKKRTQILNRDIQFQVEKKQHATQ